ncbi:UDP-N-acetylglucosamine 2-epimerase (non-hydrolyzing) [Alphaproteobacteria bacterium]|nr:UDP-N-acetylglucosamine 2-epimerase (non-hydrolyzing) [Alphaproteobacteria bacterium]
MDKFHDIWVVVGTRPECIKQVPLYLALIKKPALSTSLVGTGQHRELLNNTIKTYGVSLDMSFETMKSGQSLPDLIISVIDGFQKLVVKKGKPDIVIVQGDTTTALAVSIAAFNLGIKIAHNEAGLRTYNLNNPFPEESNRKIISTIASFHFAPTKESMKNLIKEGINKNSIYVVGNTGIDSLFWALKKDCPEEIKSIINKLNQDKVDFGLITAHRRESAGKSFENIFNGVHDFLEVNKNFIFIYPTHPNGLGQVAAEEVFGRNSKNLNIIKPVDYISLVHLIKSSKIIMTDSGGIQEEAATIGRPTVICREYTERNEAVQLGIAKIGTQSRRKIFEALQWANINQKDSEIWSHRPFGEGNSGEKIASILFNIKKESML